MFKGFGSQLWVGVCWKSAFHPFPSQQERAEQALGGLEVQDQDPACAVSPQVSGPQTSAESHVFSVAVLPQPPGAPRLSPGSSLHVAVSVNPLEMAGVKTRGLERL